MTKQNQNVPALRFPEFNRDWDKQTLDKWISEYREHSTENNQYIVLTSSNKGLMKQSDYYGENRITVRDNLGFNVIPNGYITYRSRSDDRKFTFNLNNLGITGIISVYYPVFTIMNGSNKFFVEYFNYQKHFLGRYSVGTSQQVLSLNDLRSIKLHIPSSEEQHKIAAFLTAVDELIQQLTKKKDLLQQYKKGVVQKIFNQEIRFKDDNGYDFDDWEEKKLGHYLRESRKQGTSGDIAKKLTVKLWGKGVHEKNEKLAGSANTKYYKRRAGQFIYSKLDFLNCAFGIVPKELDGYESTVDLPCFDVSPKLNPTFLLETVKREEFYLKNGMTADGSRKARRIHADVFLDFLIQIPALSEQNKIANFLTAINDKINLTNQQLEKTQTFKKGLLQQMFI